MGPLAREANHDAQERVNTRSSESIPKLPPSSARREDDNDHPLTHRWRPREAHHSTIDRDPVRFNKHNTET